MKHRVISAAMAALSLTGGALAQPVLNAATLPNSRTADVGETVTIFASVINSGDVDATGCGVGLAFGADASLSVEYAAADGAGNVTGTQNTPVTIAQGATQQFVVGVSASAAYDGAVPLTYGCLNGQAISATGLNDLALIATDDPIADVITIGATLTDDGIMDAANRRRGLLSLAAVNIGDGDPPPASPDAPQANEAAITVSARVTNFTAGGQFPIRICQTDAGGVCLAAPADALTLDIGDSAVLLRAEIVRPAYSDSGFPFFPGEYRVTVDFHDSSGRLVGATSAAVSSDARAAEEAIYGAWEIFARDGSDPGSAFTRKGWLFIPAGSLEGGPENVIYGAVMREPFGGEPYAQPFWAEAQFSALNDGRSMRMEGCAHFLDTGRGDQADPYLTLTVQGRRQVRATWDAPAGAGCGLPAQPPRPDQQQGPDSPLVDFQFSVGIMYGANFNPEDVEDGFNNDEIDLLYFGALLDGQVFAVSDPYADTAHGSVTFDHEPVGETHDFGLSGAYRDCDLEGFADWDIGVGLSDYRANYTLRVWIDFSNCAPESELEEAPHFGSLGFSRIDLNEDTLPLLDEVEGFGQIFTDGFESGDTSAWTTSLPD